MDKQIYTHAERKLERELSDIISKENMTMNDLDALGKIIDGLKDISIVCAMKKEEENEGYSERRYYYDDASYARGRGTYARRDSMGRYSSDEGSSYDDYSNRGYSRDDEMRYAERRMK